MQVNQFMKNLIHRSKGDRTISKYSKDSNISYAYISRILNNKLDVFPTDKLVDKIVLASNPPLSEQEVNNTYETYKDIKTENAIKKIKQLQQQSIQIDENSIENETYTDEERELWKNSTII